MLVSRISVGATDKFPDSGRGNEQVMARSYDVEGHAPKCVERELRVGKQKNIERLYEDSTPCLDDHQFKPEELETVGELSKVCYRIVLKCIYLARIGRPDILWSANQLARVVTKWTRACDRRLARLISFHK